MAGINLKLQGQFKFDIYNSNKELISSSEYIDNFITNSGVMYPYHFTFADCFRYLTIGSGTLGNSIAKSNTIAETTGLQIPIPVFSYIGGRTNFNSGVNATNYTSPGQFGAACGYVQTASGVSLIRSWAFPDNSGDAFDSSQTFGEFMVTPGRPYVTGADKIPLCSCSEISTTFDATGLDCSATAEYYNWLSDKYSSINGQKRLKICDATKAFARVSFPITVNQGDILNVIYKLNIGIDTGIHFSSLVNGVGTNNWQGILNSYNNITQPGVALINDGVVGNSIAPNGNQRLQHFDYTPGANRIYLFENEYGESFVPPMGIPLEPSAPYFINQLNNQSITYYLSDDDTQFLVSASGGPLVDSGDYKPWNPTSSTGVIYPITSGLLPFSNQNDKVLTNPNIYWSQNPNIYNIRKRQGAGPSVNDITTSAAMAANSFAASKTAQPLFSLLYINKTNSSIYSGIRTGQVVYNSNFSNYTGNSLLYAKSFVAAYKDIAYGVATYPGDTQNLIPFFDAVFSGTNTGFLPNLITGIIGYNTTGATIDTSLATNFNTLQNVSLSAYPLFNTVLTWSVPCPYGVTGC
jgi:hypothetical protein